MRTNPNAMHTVQRNTLFTNVGLTGEGGVYWEGIDHHLPPRTPIYDWQGRPWSPGTHLLPCHPWYSTPIYDGQCQPCSPSIHTPDLPLNYSHRTDPPVKLHWHLYLQLAETALALPLQYYPQYIPYCATINNW